MNINNDNGALGVVTFRQCNDALPIFQNNQTKRLGFTLIELLIVIAIIGILSTVAVPMYTNYVQQSRIADALATLGNLSTKMERNYLDFRKYNIDQDCAVDEPNTGTSSNDFSYSCVSSGQDYTWTATSNNDDYKFSVNNNFNKQTLTYDGQDVSSNNCWMISKGGACY